MSQEILKIYTDIAELLNIARAKAYHTVNSIMVETYRKIGQRIVEEEQGGAPVRNTERNLLKICQNTSPILLAKDFRKQI